MLYVFLDSVLLSSLLCCVQVGFQNSGKIMAIVADIYSNAGSSLDVSHDVIFVKFNFLKQFVYTWPGNFMGVGEMNNIIHSV